MPLRACMRKTKAGGINPPLREAVVARAEELDEAEVASTGSVGVNSGFGVAGRFCRGCGDYRDEGI